MWEVRIHETASRGAHRLLWSHAGERLTYGEVTALWRGDATFREHFIAVLREAPFDAYFWETPPVNDEGQTEPFECVLVDSAELVGVRPDQQSFRVQLAGDPDGSGVAAFWNLGHDALLIAPRMQGHAEAYSHLAAFSRNAPAAQQHALWAAVGGALESMIGPRPIWVSTSGLGVYWLHVRLDYRPKYYTYDPYRDEDFRTV